MIILLLKISLLLSLALAVVSIMKRSTAVLKHLICATALIGSLAAPLTLFEPATVTVMRIRVHASQAILAPVSGTAAKGRVLLAIWMVGTALFLLRIAWGFFQVSRVRASAAPLYQDVHEADVTVPIVCGLFRPVILLPRGSHLWSPDRLTAVLRHERAHIARKDLWTNLAAHIACAVYWFHPLAWFTAQTMRREQEIACDDAVINDGIEAGIYAEALVATAHNLTANNLLTGCPMLTPQTLKSRIARVLDRTLPRTTSAGSVFRAGILCAAALISTGLVNPVRADDANTPPRVIHKIDPAYTVEAQDAKIEGSVLLRVVVAEDGTARDVTVTRSLDAGLDENAVIAVKQWRFSPGLRNGNPAPVRALIEVNFRLK